MTDAARSSWMEVQEEVLARIQSRKWKPGDLIPNEADLAEEFGCARATVNRALRAVAEQGLIDRRRKAGSRVALHPVRKATLKIPIIRLEIENGGGRYGYQLRSIRKQALPAKTAKELGFSPGKELIHLRALHLSDDKPYVFEDRWINQNVVPEAEHADFSNESANEWLVRNASFTSGSITLSAITTNWKEAELLGTETGTALMALDRITYLGKDVVTSVRLLYRPGYKVHTEI